jgi:cytochrome c biogenesis protein CcmG, thiol:disulfide interchange protein DsbE
VKSSRFILIALLFIGVAGLPGCTDTPSTGLTGKTAPDFTIQDFQRTVSLHDYRGKVVLLNLWATWCPPCIEEIPDLNRLQNRMGDKISIVAVSYDDTEGAYKQFIQDHKLDFLTVHDRDHKLKDLYQPTGPPESYVIDRSGRILRKFIGPQHWGDDDFLRYLNKL